MSAANVAAPSTIYLGLDVHKESITVAVLPGGAPAPTRVEKLVDWRRFEFPRQLTAYLSLVPREDSTGNRERKGQSRRRATMSVVTSSFRRRGAIGIDQNWVCNSGRVRRQPALVVAISWKAQSKTAQTV
jgi:hypothetical protein